MEYKVGSKIRSNAFIVGHVKLELLEKLTKTLPKHIFVEYVKIDDEFVAIVGIGKNLEEASVPKNKLNKLIEKSKNG